jgi:hypothetical protein
LIGQTESKTYIAVKKGGSTAVVAVKDDEIARIEIGD